MSTINYRYIPGARDIRKVEGARVIFNSFSIRSAMGLMLIFAKVERHLPPPSPCSQAYDKHLPVFCESLGHISR